MSRCRHCPTPPDLACWGESARHLCRHMDPDDPIYRPGHAEGIVALSRSMADHATAPTPARMAADLGKALFDWACSGFRMASEEEQARRLAICHACAQWDGGWCRLCRCALWAKVRMKTEHCPLPEPKW